MIATNTMVISKHVVETTLKKALCLCFFLRLMHMWDGDSPNLISPEIHAKVLAEQAGFLLGMSTSFVYRCYKEWGDGQEVLAIEASEKGLELKSGRGYFLVDRRGSYERRFLLHEEDLKVQFRRWMRKNLRNLTDELA